MSCYALPPRNYALPMQSRSMPRHRKTGLNAASPSPFVALRSYARAIQNFAVPPRVRTLQGRAHAVPFREPPFYAIAHRRDATPQP